MFGPSKDELIDNLIDSWNALAQARNESLRFIRIKRGWDWLVVLEVLTFKDEVEIQIILCESAGQAKEIIKGAVERPSEIGAYSVHRTVGPYGQMTAANAGLQPHASWIDSLNKHGQLRTRYGPPPGRISD